MTLPVRFDERLLRDVAKARDWYEKQQEGLGERFVAAFYATLAEVVQSPNACPLFQPLARGRVRHVLIRGFPYACYFAVDSKEIFVFLLFHGARDPQALRGTIARRYL